MDRIRSWLYIGKYRETLNEQALVVHNISAVLQLEEVVKYSSIDALYIPVEDGIPLSYHLLRQGLDFVLAAKRKNKIVLIACGAGISRSVTFAVAALKEIEGIGLLEALRTIHTYHLESLPHPALWESLCAYYHENITIHEMLSELH